MISPVRHGVLLPARLLRVVVVATVVALATLSTGSLPLLAGDVASVGPDGSWLDLGWGSGKGQVGYYNHTVEGFQEMSALGPQALLEKRNGQVVIADTWNDRLLVYSSSAKLLRTFEGPHLRRPWALAEGADESLHVLQGETSQIVHLDGKGRLTGAFGGHGDGPDQFVQIASLEADTSGRLYCGDLGAGRVSVHDSRGGWLMALPWSGTGLALGSGGAVIDLTWSSETGYAVRSRRLNGDDRLLFDLQDRELQGGRVLGVDGSGRIHVRFSRADEPGQMLVLRFEAAGKGPVAATKLPLLPATQAVRVLPDGGLLWFDHDATRAPAGVVQIRRQVPLSRQ